MIQNIYVNPSRNMSASGQLNW